MFPLLSAQSLQNYFNKKNSDREDPLTTNHTTVMSIFMEIITEATFLWFCVCVHMPVCMCHVCIFYIKL